MAEAPQHRELLAGVGQDGVLPCACGRPHVIGTREVLLGSGAIEQAGALLERSRGRGSRLWFLSDEHTEAAAGERCKRLLPAAHVAGCILPGAPRPVPTLALARALLAEVRAAAPDLLVAVGGGVVSDLVKWASREAGVPSWCVATSPAVDAYTSATAALRMDGRHGAVPARPSEVVICDLDVMAAAPPLLFLAGMGDLLAKWLAHLDWRLGQLVTGEPFCERVAAVALASARGALAAVRAFEEDPRGATAGLADAILASGLAMQAMGSSRPAASAEHTIAHAWEADGGVPEELALHALLVGAGSRLVLRGYQAWYRRLPELRPDPAARAAAIAAEPPWADRLPAGVHHLRAQLDAEQRPPLHAALLARRAEAFERARPQLAELAGAMLGELEAAVALLDRLGFPFAPAGLGLAEPALSFPVRHVRLLRNRYTTFDLAHELGDEAALVAAATAAAHPLPSAPQSRSARCKPSSPQEKPA